MSEERRQFPEDSVVASIMEARALIRADLRPSAPPAVARPRTSRPPTPRRVIEEPSPFDADALIPDTSERLSPSAGAEEGPEGAALPPVLSAAEVEAERAARWSGETPQRPMSSAAPATRRWSLIAAFAALLFGGGGFVLGQVIAPEVALADARATARAAALSSLHESALAREAALVKQIASLEPQVSSLVVRAEAAEAALLAANEKLASAVAASQVAEGSSERPRAARGNRGARARSAPSLGQGRTRATRGAKRARKPRKPAGRTDRNLDALIQGL